MAAKVERGIASGASAEDAEAELRALGGDPWRWTNSPGVTYGWHSHPQAKTLYCVTGSIVFHTRSNGDVEMRAGDRLRLAAGVDHAATAGPDGVLCVEAYIPVV